MNFNNLWYKNGINKKQSYIITCYILKKNQVYDFIIMSKYIIIMTLTYLKMEI